MALRTIMVLLICSMSSVARGFGLQGDAPSAEDIQGVHILLENDLDSMTPKFSFLLLSKPRTYRDGEQACQAFGEETYNHMSGSPNLFRALNASTAATEEIKTFSMMWVKSGDPLQRTESCTALDKSGTLRTIPCDTPLPIVCLNSAPKRFLRISSSPQTNRQIKVELPTSKSTSGSGTGSGGKVIVQGFRDRNSFRFLGIPFASAPVGPLRFAAPQPYTKQDPTKIMDATQFGAACPQPGYNDIIEKTRFFYLVEADQSEDCLFLNVFTPSLKDTSSFAGLPVMVFIHGGSFLSYSGSLAPLEPGNMVSRGGIVVVTINYRLGILGTFEYAPAISRSDLLGAPGNLAVRDQMMALQWVQDNIKAFGGDPARVTIMGESAGATSVRALLTIPSAFGLYKNAVAMSDPLGQPFSTQRQASDIIGNLTLNALHCKSSLTSVPSDPNVDGSAILSCLRSKSVGQIIAVQKQMLENGRRHPECSWMVGDLLLAPTVDGVLIHNDISSIIQDRSSSFNAEASLLLGTTKDESSFFVPTKFPKPLPATMEMALKAVESYVKSTEKARLVLESGIEGYGFNASDPDTVRGILIRFETDFLYRCPVQAVGRMIVQRQQSSTGKLFVYRFMRGKNVIPPNSAITIPAYCGKNGQKCVGHFDDVVPVFGSGDVYKGIEQTGDEAMFAREAMDRFIQFFKTGSPDLETGSDVDNGGRGKTESGGIAASSIKEKKGDNGTVERGKGSWPEFDDDRLGLYPTMELNLNTSHITPFEKDGACAWMDKNIKLLYQVHPAHLPSNMTLTN